MKKYYIGGAVVIIIGIFIYLFSTQNSAATPTPVASTTTETGVTDNNGSGTTNSTSSSGSSGGQYTDGTYTGDVANATYGNLQVAVVISDGKLAQINLLQYPDAPGHTTQVNQSALPILQQEAITMQSANVNIVSGATQTSQAFQESLGVALTAAKA